MMTDRLPYFSFFGPYRILNRLGIGAYSEIYLVERNEKLFALKKNKPQYTYDSDIYSILVKEGDILEKLQHAKHFPTFFEAGVHEDCHYLVMEYVEGLSLTLLLQHHKEPVNTSLACHIAFEICRGIEEIHGLETKSDQPVIHGDLKLDNVMLDLKGNLKIIDVGLKGGTFRYMPLERHHEKRLTPYSDIYAIGHILYELTHGKHLFEKGNKAETYLKMRELKVSEDIFRSDLSEKVKDILTRCLHQEAENRYSTVTELKKNLETTLKEEKYQITPQPLADWVAKYKRPRVQIKKIGKFLEKDEEGFLINESSADKIKPPWTEAVEAVKQAYLENLGDRVHSIYLRGSVGRGNAILGLSDIDTFAVLKGSKEQPDFTWTRALYRDFKKKFPYTNGVDAGFIHYDSLFQGMSLFSYRFIIKVLAACIYGENLADKIPKFKPNLRIAFFYHGNLREVLNETIENIQKAPGPDQVKIWSNYALRRILRLGFAINIEKEKQYTRDLYPCYEVFSKYYPEHETEMRQALDFVLNLPTDKEEILPFLKSFGGWLIMESERIFAGKK